MRKPLTEPKIVDFREDKFDREIVPGVAHMKHTFGNNVSVALFKIARGKGSSFPKNRTPMARKSRCRSRVHPRSSRTARSTSSTKEN